MMLLHKQFIQYAPIKSIEDCPPLFQEKEEVFVSEQIDGKLLRLGMVEGELLAGSGTMVYPRPDDFTSDIHYTPFQIQPVYSLIEVLGRIYNQVILFGILYGNGHYRLGHQWIGFRAIDLYLVGNYLDYPVFLDICKKHGIETAPLIARIPYALSRIKTLSDGKTLLMHEYPHMRKGVIIHPLRERIDAAGNRVILKMDNVTYRKK